MNRPTFFYLASQSPRRAELLKQLGVPFKPLLPDRNEDMELLEQPRSNEPPREYVHRVAKLKLLAARARLKRRGLPEAPILTADTTVALGRRLFGKPAGPAEAVQMLRALSGRMHRVYTVVCVSHGRYDLVDMSESKVRFTHWPQEAIDRYVDSQEPAGKAGAYAIQGKAARWVTHIEGSYSGIMGLPLYETGQLLNRAGLLF